MNLADQTDLQRAYEALAAKLTPYTTLWDFYRGKAPLVYTNERLAEIFRNLDVRFTENWAAVVVDAASDRIALTALNASGNADAMLLSLWSECELGLVADDVHEAVLVCGEGYVIVWPNAADELRVYYNDPRLCHVFYDEEDPHVVSLAAKWYDTREKKRRLTLYYPGRLEYYESTGKAENISSAKSFEPMQPPSAPNPYGEIPVFQFRTRNDIRSELDNVVPLQNGINKLLADMIVAAEYGAYKQRWIITAADDLKALKNAPNEIWAIPAGDGVGQGTSVGEFSATDLNLYLNAVDKLAGHLAVITRTPKHYLFGQGGDPSGEALIAMEAPLNQKCSDYIERFIPTWRRVGAFMAKLSGLALTPSEITPQFRKPETVQPLTEAQIVQTNTSSGLPLVTALRRQGWTEAELEQLRKDKQEQAGEQQASLASALVAAQRQMDQGQQPGNAVAGGNA